MKRAIQGGALLLALLAGGLAGAQLWPVDDARAQRLLTELPEEPRALGRLPGTALVYVEFQDGSRCVATDDGTGDLDCDWSD